MSDLERPTVIVTSADAGEGKTATTVNLARSLVAAGRRVVLVDLDLRHPDVHHWFGMPNDVGVTDILLDRRPLNECLQYIEIDTGEGGPAKPLYVLPTGPKVENPAELLGGGRTARMLDALAPQADIVLIDTPPVLLVADTLVIGRMVAGALLVVETKRTPTPAVQQAKDALIRNQTRLLGLVLNKYVARDSMGDGYGYGYGQGYGYGYGPAVDGNGSSSGS
jgi:capsular exopolysaccharide synthesis family protein